MVITTTTRPPAKTVAWCFVAAIVSQMAHTIDPMIHIPVLRWGEPYKSLEVDKVVHFDTGEVLAEVSRANAALVERDMRHAFLLTWKRVSSFSRPAASSSKTR